MCFRKQCQWEALGIVDLMLGLRYFVTLSWAHWRIIIINTCWMYPIWLECRTSPSSVPSKSSPRSISSEAKSSSPQEKVSPKVARQLKTGPRFLDPTASSSNQASRTPKERSPKVAVERKSPRSPLSEVHNCSLSQLLYHCLYFTS